MFHLSKDSFELFNPLFFCRLWMIDTRNNNSKKALDERMAFFFAPCHQDEFQTNRYPVLVTRSIFWGEGVLFFQGRLNCVIMLNLACSSILF
jgi:hypothetical protein